ncbi:SAM-dependent methyltransferase [Mycolicibacterium monacense]|uniref:Putative S-adenosyl-L-methionine-dependent methyltransferase Mjls_1072 n=2 Tax=Mycobacteriaceae TaxID=1762 RepID=Y1072_MYCSJ|nr:class I SAM-dependent methyltransferase [Mycolicibacterium monacense]A3PVF2.1 RecName: Full=Putative S-adenosyl-L-methionine-dependent methyltransferase Mjls_1072 [Mycobacterium sp. JLS]MDA4101290.1 S-adenosyl-L-methionine-dependent methyltransferase [Mycolicibacterium monacense DSM 44395]OBB62636.1 SAM-dependent methyltransferase [Mycolicibacterium monacense]ORB20752.1 SAM-dependent methyltransferase [Mycolicibacterium monacense DSM 44395]QHP84881.1 class I SAM-dependent methyltransferase 
MARSDEDSWDLASSVGATATMVAAARAVASRGPEALIDDPYADALVRAVGVEYFVKLLDGEITLEADNAAMLAVMTDVMAVRTRFFDDFFLSSGLPQAVILASGLDARAYRLPWPSGSVVYEIDQPEVIEFKTRTLADLGASPAAELRTVAIDLRDDWPRALRDRGFDPTAPTAWIAEGLLIYLPPDAQDRLFDNITALSAPGSRLATEFHPDAGARIGASSQRMAEEWRRHGLDLDMADLFYDGERNPVVDYLRERGWEVEARSRPDMFAHYGRPFPTGEAVEALRQSLAVTATRR